MPTQTRFLATSLGAVLFFSLSRLCFGQAATLDQAEALLKSGQTEQARVAVNAWKKANSGNVRAQANAGRAAFLTARLATRAQDAEDSYLTVALSHPTSPHAAESLLRLGQARLASGDAKQALVYLQRLAADYPRSEHRALGAVWLARAQLTSGRASAACTTATAGLQLSQLDSETAALLRAEQTTACTAPVTAPVAAAPQVSDAADSAPTKPQGKPSAPAVAHAGRYTIQVAAFRERAGAQTVVRQLEKAGISDARLVTVTDNALIRVRIGRFESSAAAAAQLNKLKAAGFAPIVVADAQREKVVRD